MEKDIIPIKRALISVYDKNNIVSLAKELEESGCEIISTGGTAEILTKSGIDIIDITNVTGNPEAFSGRMKTISFQIESALLFDREKDREEANKLGINPIDLVVCNLYPFKEVLNEGADIDRLIENIDIGGPTMIRAGAKNFKYVAVITNPKDYSQIIEELKANNGGLSYETRKRLMMKAFNHSADYDSMIAVAMDNMNGGNSLRLSFTGGKKLRYGENSHQTAFFYKEREAINSLYDMKVLHGKELSFNNIIDIDGAIKSVQRLNNVACAVIKHNNPCGLCEGDNQRKVFEFAWEGDPISAFGSIIAFNKPVEKETVEFLHLNDKDKSKRKFVEVIIAPKFNDEAFTYLRFHKNLRLIEYNTSRIELNKDIRYFNGSLLLQDIDDKLYSKLEPVTKIEPNIDKITGLIEFGLKAITNIKSNSIIIVREKESFYQLLGMGAGQPNRLISIKLALEKCKENLLKEYNSKTEVENDIKEYSSKTKQEEYIKKEMAKAILISDAFFPFPDNIQIANQYNIKTIIQPGGSIKDKLVIEECNNNGIAMIFTGIRHFKH